LFWKKEIPTTYIKDAGHKMPAFFFEELAM